MASEQKIDALLDAMAQVRTPTSVSISPDGKTVAWAFNGTNGSELHLTAIAAGDGGSPMLDRVISPDTAANASNSAPGRCAASHPNWSPDGKELAFLSECAGAGESWRSTEQNDIFVWTPGDNTLKQTSHLHGEVSSIQWSPDGKAIGFLYVENATRRPGATDAMKPWNGVYGEDGVEVQRVAAVGAADFGKSTESAFFYVTPPKLHVFEFNWAPDSHQIVFVAANPPGENNWWVAQLFTRVAIRPWDATGEPCPTLGECHPVSVLLDPQQVSGPLHGMQIAVPRFSPDGKQIAFIGGLMSDQGSVGGDIYVIPAAGMPAGIEPKDVTPGRAASPAYIAWLNDNYLGVSEHVGGSSHITAVDVRSGKDLSAINLTLPETIIAGVDVMSVSAAKDPRTVAMIRESFTHGPEVWAGPIGAMKQISYLNDAVKPPWGRAESIDYTNEGFHIQGWLIYPAGYDPAKRYPLIVSVHGGPSSAVTPRWPTLSYGAVPLAALGYFVFEPNPRGSFGQGEAFTRANIKDFGYGDLRDVLAGVDVIEKRFPIDTQREGITGWSYGGFMTMFAVTQTSRFKAAVAGAGISNWQSYYGENSIDQWMIPFFGASVYDDPAVYARSSAIDFIKRAKTPTLLVVGDRDGECPAPQSFEFWHALRDEGVKTQLVIYPNEGHHLSNEEHKRDVLRRELAWFEAEMPEK